MIYYVQLMRDNPNVTMIAWFILTIFSSVWFITNVTKMNTRTRCYYCYLVAWLVILVFANVSLMLFLK